MFKFKKKDNIVKNKKSNKIKNIIEYTIIFLVILFNANLVIQSVSHPNKTPSVFGKKAFVIVSGSMIPEIQIGDIVIANEVDSVKINDVIAFRKNSNVIVHRIIKEMNINGKVMYQTKGDNNNVADSELVDFNRIEGVIIGKIHYVGKILIFLYNNLSFVIVGIIITLIIRYFWVKNIK